MSPLDIILTNVVSYMGGILTGLFISYKIKQINKEKNKDKDKDNRELEHNNISPIPTAPAYPVTPPMMALNPEYVSNKPVTKLVFSTE